MILDSWECIIYYVYTLVSFASIISTRHISKPLISTLVSNLNLNYLNQMHPMIDFIKTLFNYLQSKIKF